MKGNRKAIANALFDLLKAAHAWKKATRSIRIYSKLSPADYPAMFLHYVGEEDTDPNMDGLKRYLLHFDLVLNDHAPANPDAIPEDQLLDLLKAIDDALLPTLRGKQTLGEKCDHAWIEGEVLADAAILSPELWAQIPIRVRCGI